MNCGVLRQVPGWSGHQHESEVRNWKVHGKLFQQLDYWEEKKNMQERRALWLKSVVSRWSFTGRAVAEGLHPAWHRAYKEELVGCLSLHKSGICQV